VCVCVCVFLCLHIVIKSKGGDRTEHVSGRQDGS